MSTKIYVNLPVRDLNRSIDFFTQIGFAPDERFRDDRGVAMVISDDIVVMLLTEPFFQSFTSKKIADAMDSTEVIVALGVDSRHRVDQLVTNALAAGGAPGTFASDEDFMYGRSFTDPDGHSWEVLYVDETALPQPA